MSQPRAWLGIFAGLGSLAALGLVVYALSIPKPDPGPTPVTNQNNNSAEPVEGVGEKPPPLLKTPAGKDRELLDGLRKRFKEEQLKGIAQESVTIEDAARNELGESDAAYERMAEAWAELCKKHKITEEERDALENEAIRQQWISPPPD